MLLLIVNTAILIVTVVFQVPILCKLCPLLFFSVSLGLIKLLWSYMFFFLSPSGKLAVHIAIDVAAIVLAGFFLSRESFGMVSGFLCLQCCLLFAKYMCLDHKNVGILDISQLILVIALHILVIGYDESARASAVFNVCQALIALRVVLSGNIDYSPIFLEEQMPLLLI